MNQGNSGTRATYKWEQVNNSGIGIYGSPEEITLREHQEVYAWFSNHIVTWTNNPTYWHEGSNSRSTIDGYARVINNNLSQAGYGSLIQTPYLEFNESNKVLRDYKMGTDLSFTDGWVQTVAENDQSEPVYYSFKDGEALYSKNSIYYKYDGIYVEADENGEMKENGTTADFSSIFFYKVIPASANNPIDLVLYKNRQNKIFKESNTGVYHAYTYNNGFILDPSRPDVTNRAELELKKGTLDKAANMNYVCYWEDQNNGFIDQYGNQTHLNDWNNHDAAYGWGRQPSTSEPDGLWKEYQRTNETKQIGTLITDANVNNWSYKCSEDGGQLHDKYIMVYLKGDGYEGWYIGFDYEASNSNPASNQSIYSDGICNDWIIKLTAAHNELYENIRIMCEDLGGNYGTSTTDIDYNDIVLDVTNAQTNWGSTEVVTLTLQAAGGTLPLIVTYTDKAANSTTGTELILFETHEMFEKDMVWSSRTDSYVQDVDYGIMYNTQAETKRGDKSPKTFTLFRGTTMSGNNTKRFNNPFNVRNIKFKVYRHGIEDYKANPPSGEPMLSDWISLDNIDGEPPIMICVPNTVDWLKERHKISDGYPTFRNWVSSPSLEFWNPDDNDHVVHSHLVNE